MWYLLACAPLVWAVALFVSVDRARDKVNELFDTELIKLARQVQSTLAFSNNGSTTVALPPPPASGTAESGDGDVRDLAIAVWDEKGRLIVSDREGGTLPFRPDSSGFLDQEIGGKAWRVYYLHSFNGERLVAAGQRAYERQELVLGLTASQVVPWLLVLPVLLVLMAWAVRRALAPVHQLTVDLHGRKADDLLPVAEERVPAELKPMVAAMNGLFARIEDMLLRERRFTADAAHELRTPLAVLRLQWDVVRGATNEAERQQAERKLSTGFNRMERLVTQMLALSRVESATAPTLSEEIRWPVVVENAVNDCLALSDRRRIELDCEWPPEGTHPMPLLGDEYLLTVLLRNLLDNAVRYAPADSTVKLRLGNDQLDVTNGGEVLSDEVRARLGERFYRSVGHLESGSGLGISIVQRIAEMHGLRVTFAAGDDGTGVKATVRFASPAA